MNRNTGILIAAIPAMLTAACDGSPGGFPLPDTIGGTVNVGSFRIASGERVSVTSDLIINADGDVQIDGELIADAQPAPDGSGHSITVLAKGGIAINGTIQAGEGISGASPQAAKNRAPSQSQANSDTPGGDGGAVELKAGGDLTIGMTAHVSAGSGGDGGTGELGGSGGGGGDIRLGAGGILSVQGVVVLGDGGVGGDSSVLAPIDNDDALLGGAGGDSGALFVKAPTIQIPGYDAEDHAIDVTVGFQIQGGVGGFAGLVLLGDLGDFSSAKVAASAQLSGNSPPTGSVEHVWCRSGSACNYVGARGGNGWFFGGNGAMVRFAQVKGNPHGVKQFVGITGGRGGDLIRKETPFYGGSVTAIGGRAGNGGDAAVQGAWGFDGDDTHWNGNEGGHASAFGGKGGNGAKNLLQYGGKGGDALAWGGWGGSGNGGCYRIGNGGKGGNATAVGGNGGDAGFPGAGGDARATGGDGGQGGAGGAVPGQGGAGGDASATPGRPGQRGTRDFGAPAQVAIAFPLKGTQGDPGIDNRYGAGPNGDGCPDSPP